MERQFTMLDQGRRFRFTLRQLMVVVAILALDFARLPARYLLGLITVSALISFLGAARDGPTANSEFSRKRTNVFLFGALAVYAVIDICAAALAMRILGEGGVVVLVMFASLIPACIAVIVIILFLARRSFDGLAVFSFLNLLAVMSWENYFYGMFYGGAI